MNKIHFKFLKVANENPGEAIIEGFANYNDVDSVNERLDPQSMILDRFKKNPILLFNHDTDYPVGKVVEIEARPEGVFVKACVSASKESRVKYIHDLVTDGTLKTFSVRFTAKDAIPDPENKEVTLFKNWELQEVSIVSIPMQADSVFSFVGIKSFGDFKKEILRMKGAGVASYLAGKIDEAIPGAGSKDELMEQLQKQTNMSAEQIASILAGDVTPVPDEFLAGACQVLGCSKEELDKLNAQDASKASEPVVTEAPETQLDPAVQQCVEEKIPALLSAGKTQEEAVAEAISLCNAKGCSVAHMEKFLAFADKTKQALAETPPPNDNPMLSMMQQLVALVGAVKASIDELKSSMLEMSNKMSQGSNSQKPGTEVPKEGTEEDPILAKKLSDLETRLKNLV